jgi:hypothetical protein
MGVRSGQSLNEIEELGGRKKAKRERIEKFGERSGLFRSSLNLILR